MARSQTVIAAESKLLNAIKAHKAFRRELMSAYDSLSGIEDFDGERGCLLDINTDAVGMEASIETVIRLLKQNDAVTPDKD